MYSVLLLTDYGKEQEPSEASKENQSVSSGVNAGGTRTDNGTSGSGSTGERASKRSRRTRTDTVGVTSQSDTANNSPDIPAPPELPPRREAAPVRVCIMFQFSFFQREVKLCQLIVNFLF